MNHEERHLGGTKTGKPIYSKIGRYGPFVQLGDNDDEDKRSISLKKGFKYTTLTFDEALECLAYPIELGEYKDAPVTINIGRYGVYIKHGEKNYSMKDRSVENLQDAIELIDEIDSERANREIHTFEHDGDPLNVLNGRYGPYISHKKKNYKIPKDQDPKKLTLDDCLTIIKDAPKKKTRRKKK